MRGLKIVAAVLVGLIGTLAFLNNLFNITSAHSFVSAVIAAPEQPFYKVIGPTFSSALAGWLGLVVIMATELTAGFLGFMGAMRMNKSKAADSILFQQAKSPAIAGAFIGVIVWYGFFITIGEMYFNMWQTEIGIGSVGGAFRYGTVCAVLMFFLSLPDD